MLYVACYALHALTIHAIEVSAYAVLSHCSRICSVRCTYFASMCLFVRIRRSLQGGGSKKRQVDLIDCHACRTRCWEVTREQKNVGRSNSSNGRTPADCLRWIFSNWLFCVVFLWSLKRALRSWVREAAHLQER